MAEDALPRGLCGIRLTRNGPVQFVDPNGLDPHPGQIVVLDLTGEQRLAAVVFTPQQIVSSEVGISPAGRVIRVATSEDLARLAQNPGADANGVVTAGLPARGVEWLAGDGDEAVVREAGDDEDRAVGSFIERLFPGG